MRKFYLLWLILVAAWGCRTQQEAVQFCPPPPPPPSCAPGVWNGTPIDTSLVNFSRDKYYRVIEPLSMLNSPRDEFQISFLDEKRAVVTRTRIPGDFSSTEMLSASVEDPTTIRYQQKNQPAFGTAAGNVSYSAGTYVFAGMSASHGVFDSDLHVLRDAGQMQSAAPLSQVNSSMWDSHPALTPDGTFLFFSSDREGGYGGTDIWFVERKTDGSWGTPKNCGPGINTPCDEITPFVTRDGRRLLFSSAGHETVGGYDIFFSEISSGLALDPMAADFSRSSFQRHFSPAKNFGAPVNTRADEIFPTSYAGLDSVLYYSSNQRSPEDVAQLRGGFDLYVMHKVYLIEPHVVREQRKLKELRDRIEISQLEMPDVDSTFVFRGEVRDVRRNPVDSADITVRVHDQGRVIDQTRTDKKGEFTLELPRKRDLEITAEKENLFYEKFRVRVDDTASVVTHTFVLPEQLFLRINFPTDEYANPYEYVLDSNGRETGESWRGAIRALASNILKYQASIRRIILVGHTDDVASDAYNLQLGRRRVHFVVDELVREGVPRRMLDARSAGEREPLAQRPGEDLDTYRKRLRRVELSKVMNR